MLVFLCPDATHGAAEILDHRTIMRCVARDSRREFFSIDANSKQSHCTIPGFCTCQFCCYQVMSKPEALLCKHELAVMLARALGHVQTTELDDAAWATAFSLALSLPLSAYGTS